MAQTITLRDNTYKIIGYVDVQDNGNKTLRDEHYQIKGYYEAQNNITRDEHYSIVGYEDILTSLL